MKKWETIRDRVESRDGSSIDYVLNRRDREGWELVTVVKIYSSRLDEYCEFDLYFKRRKIG